jgi:transposase InsO family protein
MPLTRADRNETMMHLARKLDDSPHGERDTLIETFAAGLTVSKQTVYRWLHQVGWTSGRKTRADKGESVVPAEALAFVGSMQKASVRQNGKVTLATPTAVSIAAQNGVDLPASVSTIRRQLRARGLDVRSQARAASHVEMRSLHPNHVHQVDASLCLLIYMNGQQRVIRDDELYKNKLELLAKVKLRVIRWVLVDHFSSMIVPWYTEAAGEDQQSLSEFLLFAWAQQEGRVFHGVPRIVVWDKGAANGAHAIKSLLRALEVQGIPHATGNSRAKGAVEGAQNLVEKEFESRLRFEPVNSVDELNAAASNWCNAFNENRIPRQDTRLHRGPIHLSRADLWHRIREEELRYLPEADLCRALLAGREDTRKVAGELQIAFRHPAADSSLRYDVRGLEGVSVGDEVTVQPMLYGDCRVLVSKGSYDGTRREWVLEPIRDYDAAGFRVSAPVFGETFKANPQTIVEATGKALDRMAYGERSEEDIDKAKRKNEAPFGGIVDAHSHLGAVDRAEYLPRRGTEISVPDRVSVDAAPLSRLAACRALVAMLGRPLTTEENAKVGTWYPEGVPEADLPQIATAIRTKTTPFRQLGGKEASA